MLLLLLASGEAFTDSITCLALSVLAPHGPISRLWRGVSNIFSSYSRASRVPPHPVLWGMTLPWHTDAQDAEAGLLTLVLQCPGDSVSGEPGHPAETGGVCRPAARQGEGVLLCVRTDSQEDGMFQTHFRTRKMFHMLTIKQLLELVQPGNSFTTIDFKEAYFYFDVALKHRKFLPFAFQGVAYE